MTGCCCNKHVVEQQSNIPGPPIVIYKTTHDYFNNVPINMNSDGTINSYPDPKDLSVGGKHPYPTKLAKGYLLDNRGIGPKVAFLKKTYDEYSSLQHAPSISELNSMILDVNPIKEMYRCNSRNIYKNDEDMISNINDIINSNSNPSKALRKTFNKVK